MIPLKARRYTMLTTISRHVAVHGQGPTIRELGPAVGLSSPSSVSFQLDQLEKRGLLRRQGRDWRSARLTAAGERLLAASDPGSRARSKAGGPGPVGKGTARPARSSRAGVQGRPG